MPTKTKKRIDVYEIVTEKIIESLEAGVVPWRKPWLGIEGSGHANLNSKRPYTSINQLLLQLSPYESPWWVTFAGAKRLGGSVMKGEQSTLVTFRKKIEVRDTEADDPDAKRRVFMLRYYRVWNAEQCELPSEAIPEPPPEDVTFDPCAKAERMVKDYVGKYGGPQYKHGTMAVYAPALDQVVVPRKSAYDGAADYYTTGFHELTHSTGHEKRLARDLTGQMGSDSYSREELIAEIGAAMLCAVAGLTPNYEASAGYIDHWKAKLTDDPKLVVNAASAAQRAAEWVQGQKPDYDDKEDE